MLEYDFVSFQVAQGIHSVTNNTVLLLMLLKCNLIVNKKYIILLFNVMIICWNWVDDTVFSVALKNEVHGYSRTYYLYVSVFVWGQPICLTSSVYPWQFRSLWIFAPMSIPVMTGFTAHCFWSHSLPLLYFCQWLYHFREHSNGPFPATFLNFTYKLFYFFCWLEPASHKDGSHSWKQIVTGRD